jgi:hypothetical protein
MKKIIKLICIIATLPMCDACYQRDPSVDSISVNVNVEIRIGDLLYNNIDATIHVSGYNADGILQWQKAYQYVGPGHNTLSVPAGFHHYDIQLDRKWGIDDTLTLSQNEIWNARANGPNTLTFTLGGSKTVRKLSVLIVSREIEIAGEGTAYSFDSRTRYVYAPDGLLQFIYHDAYNANSSRFEELGLETFTHNEGGLKVITTLEGKPNSEFQFIGNRFQNKMSLTANSMTTTLTVTTKDGRVNADYRSSNGSRTLYSFDFEYDDNLRDKTSVDGVLCSESDYTFDKNINPFSHLGFLDFYLQNWSENNMLTASVDNLSCSFPTVRPISQNFVYDDEGYPVTAITTYIRGIHTNDPTPKYHTKAEYYYE